MNDGGLTRRGLLRRGATTAGGLAVLGTGTVAAHEDHDSPVQEVAKGFALRPLAPVKLPTSLTFGPGDGSPDLYVTSIPRSGYETTYLPAGKETVEEIVGMATANGGSVQRIHLDYTPAGPVVTNLTTIIEGLNLPLGVAFRDGEMYVTDQHPNPNDNVDRVNGVVYHVGDDGEPTPIVDGLPAGLHDTNHIEFGPDGLLYVTTGSATCNGASLGPREVLPYNGSIFRVDVDRLRDDPARLYWVDGSGDRIEHDARPEDFVNREIARHPRNDDFNRKVDVVARGFRNVFGLAFGPEGVLYTGMNGSQNPASQDVFYRLDETAGGTSYGRIQEFSDVPHYGFPYVWNRAKDAPGTGGETGDQVVLRPNSEYDEAPFEVDPGDYIPGDGLMGWHVCAVGMDFPSEGQYAFPESYRGDAYIGECGAFEARNSVEKTVASRDTRNTGRKVTHVYLDDDGQPEGFRDFATGFSLITDVQFGPEGAMYIADADYGTFVVQPTPASGAFPHLPSVPDAETFLGL